MSGDARDLERARERARDLGMAIDFFKDNPVGNGKQRRILESALSVLLGRVRAEERAATFEAGAEACDLHPAEISLMAGELTRQEMRAVRAVLEGIARRLRERARVGGQP